MGDIPGRLGHADGGRSDSLRPDLASLFTRYAEWLEAMVQRDGGGDRRRFAGQARPEGEIDLYKIVTLGGIKSYTNKSSGS